MSIQKTIGFSIIYQYIAKSFSIFSKVNVWQKKIQLPSSIRYFLCVHSIKHSQKKSLSVIKIVKSDERYETKKAWKYEQEIKVEEQCCDKGTSALQTSYFKTPCRTCTRCVLTYFSQVYLMNTQFMKIIAHKMLLTGFLF